MFTAGVRRNEAAGLFEGVAASCVRGMEEVPDIVCVSGMSSQSVFVISILTSFRAAQERAVFTSEPEKVGAGLVFASAHVLGIYKSCKGSPSPSLL